MKAYKGFKKDMTCRGFQFEEGKEYVEDTAKLCKSGFHACERPLDVFNYYAPADSVYHVVELGDVTEETSDDSKRAGKRIKIGASLDIAKLCKAQFEYVKEHTTSEHTDPKMATAGDSGAATAGDYGAATAGYKGAATAGYKGAATAGHYGAATAGDSGAATAGHYGAATAGNKGAATARGSVTVGENGCATVRGKNVKARGGLGAVLTICEEAEDCSISYVQSIVVDGERFNPGTWYGFVNGEISEVEECTVNSAR